MTKVNYKAYYRDKAYLENEEHFRNIFEKRFQIIERFRKVSGTVLEIGSSTGTMLDVFQSHGWITWGVEPSKAGWEAEKKNHKIIHGFFEKVKLPKNYFDLVIMNHTLEHLDSPLEVLKKIYLVLKKDGLVYIDVPNFGGLGSRLLGKRWPFLLPEEHKHQFTKESLTEIFNKAHFQVIHFESRSGIFEFANPIKEIWKSFIGLKKRFFFNLLTFPYALVATAFNSGDSMSLLGQKKY